jgi:hypothetical protein
MRRRLEIGDEQLLILAEARARAVYAALTKDNAEAASRVTLQPGVIEDSRESGGRVASFARIAASRR